MELWDWAQSAQLVAESLAELLQQERLRSLLAEQLCVHLIWSGLLNEQPLEN